VHRTGEIGSKNQCLAGYVASTSVRKTNRSSWKRSARAELDVQRLQRGRVRLLQIREERGRGTREVSVMCGDATRCELISAVRSIIAQRKAPTSAGPSLGGNRPELGQVTISAVATIFNE